jgi:acyl-CoA thioester hydrolase
LPGGGHEPPRACDKAQIPPSRRLPGSLSHRAVTPPPFTPGYFDGTAHLFRARVYFEDTDLSGVVYHANYLRYMERARSDMLRLAGIDQRTAQEAGEGAWAVTDLAIKYRRPARLDDDLTVISTVEAVRGASVVIAQQVRCGEIILTDARVTAAFVAPNGRARRQPADWAARFNQIMTPDDDRSILTC